jgi:hypothetical protein
MSELSGEWRALIESMDGLRASQSRLLQQMAEWNADSRAFSALVARARSRLDALQEMRAYLSLLDEFNSTCAAVESGLHQLPPSQAGAAPDSDRAVDVSANAVRKLNKMLFVPLIGLLQRIVPLQREPTVHFIRFAQQRLAALVALFQRKVSTLFSAALVPVHWPHTAGSTQPLSLDSEHLFPLSILINAATRTQAHAIECRLYDMRTADAQRAPTDEKQQEQESKKESVQRRQRSVRARRLWVIEWLVKPIRSRFLFHFNIAGKRKHTQRTLTPVRAHSVRLYLSLVSLFASSLIFCRASQRRTVLRSLNGGSLSVQTRSAHTWR